MPSAFSFAGGSNITDAVGSPVFSNTTGVLTWSLAGTGVVLNGTYKFFAFNASVATPGNYNISVRTYNTTTMFESNISVAINDTTAPSSITFVSPTDADGANVSINQIVFNITATDNLGVQTIILRLFNSSRAQINTSSSASSPLSANISSLNDGIYYINATVNDSAGNSNSTPTRTITVDTTNPGVTINLPNLAGVNLSTSSVNLNVTLNEDGACAYSLDAGITNTTMQRNGNRDFNATNNSIADGTYTARYYCNDSAGNWNRTSTRIFGIDATKPLISYGVGTENDGTNITSTSIYVNFSVTETNFANVTFTLRNDSGQVNSTVFTAITRTINWSGLANANYTYNVTIYDLAGNFNSTTTRRIILDTANPGVTINLPNLAGVNLSSSSVNLNVTLNEDGACAYSLDAGITNTTMQRNGNRDFNATNNSIADGTYTVRYYCNDSAGNWNRTSTRIFGIDATKSLISYGVRTENDGVNLSQSFIYVNISVTETNLGNISFILYNASATVNTTTYSTLTLTINWSGLANANYTYNVTIYDTGGNFNSTATRRIILDTTSPSVALTCNPTKAGVGETITCSCSVTDNIDQFPTTTFTTNPSTANTGTHTTGCTSSDDAGNSATHSIPYTVELSSATSSSSGGGGGSTTSEWTKTIAYDAKEFKEREPITRELSSDNRITLKINNEQHHVGVKSIESDRVTIEVASTPQTAVLGVGEIGNFDINSDNYYDLSVRVNSIMNNKADITVSSISEAVPAVEEQEIVEEQPESSPVSLAPEQEVKGSSWWIYIIVILLVIIIIAFIIMKRRAK